MRSKKLLLLALFLSSVMILAACAPATEPEETQQPLKPEPTEPVAYPYPDSNQVTQPDNPEPYPAPGDAGENVLEPYPGMDDGNADESKVLTFSDFSVLPSDKGLQPGPVFIEDGGIVMKESYPVQVELLLIGNLPTPCHQLRVVTSKPDQDGLIQIQAYSVSDPEKMCVQVLKPFEASIPLGDFTEGDFTYSVNDELNGEFHLP
jgi:hypothetical protein